MIESVAATAKRVIFLQIKSQKTKIKSKALIPLTPRLQRRSDESKYTFSLHDLLILASLNPMLTIIVAAQKK